MEKECFKCGSIKPLEEYYRHPRTADKHLNKCKECTKKDSSERQSTLRKDSNWVVKERARGRDKHHRLYKGKVGSGSAESKKRYIKENPVRRLANQMVSNAVRDGRLEKRPCEICGNLRVHGHHDDYYKPLEVRWLCIKHHNEHHVKLRENFLSK